MAKTLPVTWLGDEDANRQIITEAGVEFVKGRPVDVPLDVTFAGTPWMDKFKQNPMFSVGEPEPEIDAGQQAEIDALKAQLDEKGVAYRANASLTSLRDLLAKAI